MTSGKSYINWLREAGRGHLVAILSWGSYGLLVSIMIAWLQVDQLYTFFGLGNNRILYLLCSGLGLILGMMEFFYLLQERKSDFYFSLPVKKSTVFYSRYLHGVLHGLLPLVSYMLICGSYQSSLDEMFMGSSVGYTFRSILVYSMIFLVFYHIAIFAICACGQMVSVLCMMGIMLWGFQFFLEHVCLTVMNRFYETFYRSPLLEMLENMLIPWSWGKSVSAQQIGEKFLLLEYQPDRSLLFSGMVWIVVSAVCIVRMQKSRKTEHVGKIFTGNKMKYVIGTLSSVLVGIVLILAGSGGIYDAYLPEESEVKTVQIALNGVDMDLDTYAAMKGKIKDYQTEVLLQKYALQGEGKEAGMRWVRMLRENDKQDLEKHEEYTKVTVCFLRKNGRNVYRTYPVSKEMLFAFADVYETMEYKKSAYPLITQDTEMMEGSKVIWYDGVGEQTLHMTEEEKKDFLELYKSDVKKLKMTDLQTAFPIGRIEIRSEIYDRDVSAVIYPFFEQCCEFLKVHEVNLEQQLFDYEVQSVRILESRFAPAGTSGGTTMKRYETEEELAEWKGRLIPKGFCIQPLLNPLNSSVDAEVQVIEEESGAVISVECYGIRDAQE